MGVNCERVGNLFGICEVGIIPPGEAERLPNLFAFLNVCLGATEREVCSVEHSTLRDMQANKLPDTDKSVPHERNASRRVGRTKERSDAVPTMVVFR